MIRLHLLAFLCGSLLDLVIGDPHSIPHPVQLIGKLISVLDSRFQKAAEGKENGNIPEGESGSLPAEEGKRKRRYGRWMAVIVIAVTAVASGLILGVGYRIHPVLGWALETVMTCQILAGRSLQRESMKVYDRLCLGTLEEARLAVSMIVGRDTEHLTKEQVTKAAVETVAENTSDGVIAPMLYTALGGPVLGWMYKAVNTMDSMVGYRNEKYMDFGRGPAHLDDAANYLPSRISAVLMIAAAWVLSEGRKAAEAWRQTAFLPCQDLINSRRGAPGEQADGVEVCTGFCYDAGNAARIWKRDRRKHASPNSAQTESVMAGALGLQLAGDAYYGGRLVKKPLIGDPLRPVEPEDIVRADRLMVAAAVICEMLLCMAGIFIQMI